MPPADLPRPLSDLHAARPRARFAHDLATSQALEHYTLGHRALLEAALFGSTLMTCPYPMA
eukprot:scaffold23652_cov129-Isochrysis_galbana.AAC.2